MKIIMAFIITLLMAPIALAETGIEDPYNPYNTEYDPTQFGEHGDPYSDEYFESVASDIMELDLGIKKVRVFFRGMVWVLRDNDIHDNHVEAMIKICALSDEYGFDEVQMQSTVGTPKVDWREWFTVLECNAQLTEK